MSAPHSVSRIPSINYVPSPECSALSLASPLQFLSAHLSCIIFPQYPSFKYQILSLSQAPSVRSRTQTCFSFTFPVLVYNWASVYNRHPGSDPRQKWSTRSSFSWPPHPICYLLTLVPSDCGHFFNWDLYQIWFECNHEYAVELSGKQ